jgi:L-asparaginase/Glu-tRNA(Gln) amidotransferase subunit D
MNPEQKEMPKVNCVIVKGEPSLTPELFNAMTLGADSVVVITYAAGGVPEKVVPNIKSKVESGTPVFLLSDNERDPQGIVRQDKYAIHQSLAQSGATAIQGINSKNLEQLMLAIQEQSFYGKKPQELAEAISQQFKSALKNY